MNMNKYEADYIEQLYNQHEEEEFARLLDSLVDDEEVEFQATYEYQLMQELEEEEYDRYLLSRYHI